jgi:hypothetical protein
MEGRGIRRVTEVHHTTIINLVKKVGAMFPGAYLPETIPEVEELDELETCVGAKNKIWLWTAVEHFKVGLFGWGLGDRGNVKTLYLIAHPPSQILGCSCPSLVHPLIQQPAIPTMPF